MSETAALDQAPDLRSLNALLAPYKDPDLRRSLQQVANTTIPFLACAAAMHLTATRGWWLLYPPLAAVGGLLLMRIFCIQHDCGHGSFFKSSWANDLLGGILGVVTLTPYRYWRQTHAVHHATSGSLDRRGWGDIDTRTIAEYQAMSPWRRRWYRVYRSWPVMFLVGPVFHFLVYHRFPSIVPADWKTERLSILKTDLALACLLFAASRTIGVGPYLLVQGTICAFASIVGVWFFYVQHQFEKSYWRKDHDWDFAAASLKGSSFYALPRVLQWFTANIGFHHIHHLNSRIPNYYLERAMKENPVFQRVTRLTLFESLKCAKLALWDEKRQRMVGFDAA